MDTQSLFGKKDKKDTKPAKKLIAVGNDIDDKPLLYGLEQNDKSLLKYGTSAQRFEWISQGVVDIAFISAIDFSRLKGGWHVLPDLCKSSKGLSRRAALFFNKNLTEIESVAITETSRTSEMVLKIILKELYQIETKFVRASGSLNASLKKCDAVLLSGDQAVHETARNPVHIDLGEEWYDLTGLPLVYGFWIVNELTTDNDDFDKLIHSYKLGSKNIDAIVGAIEGNPSYVSDYLTSTVNYNFNEEEQAGLEELYRFAFFYGFVDYIPDFNFAKVL